MVWTRLFQIPTLRNAFTPFSPYLPIMKPFLSLRQKARLEKTFRDHGVPWIYDLKPATVNQRHKRPKGRKSDKLKPIHEAKIDKALLEADDKILAFRKERVAKKPLTGLDKFIANTLPSLIKRSDRDRQEKKAEDFDARDFDFDN